MSIGNSILLAEARVGVITALPKEFAAMKAVLDCDQEVASPMGAGQSYALSRIRPRHGEPYLAVVALLPDMGNNMASAMATHLLRDCPNVRHVIMAGIAGAVPHPTRAELHVRLGDIVVSDRGGVVQYDLVKEIATGEEAFTEHRHPPRPPAAPLLQAVKHLQAEEEVGSRPWEDILDVFLAAASSEWRRPGIRQDRLQDWNDGTPPTPHPRDTSRRSGKPRVFLGTIASANNLLKNPEKRDRLRDQFGVRAVEMEGSGVADAAWAGGAGFLVVRGTCDYCNPDKGDSWQRYAAVIAAAYTRAILERLALPPASSINPDALVPNPLFSSTSGGPDMVRAGDPIYQSGSTTVVNSANIQMLQSNTPSSAEGSARLLEAVERLTARLDASSIPQDTAAEPAEATAQRRQSQDAGQALLDTLKRVLFELEYEKAWGVAGQLRAWVTDSGPQMPADVVSDAFVTIAECETVRARVTAQTGTPFDAFSVRRFLTEAKRFSQDSNPASRLRLEIRLTSLEAYLTSREGNPDSGLAQLIGRNDPVSLRRRLAILLDAERFQEAAEMVRGLPLDEEWCDQAIVAFIRGGNTPAAAEALRWARKRDNPTLARRCQLLFAEACLIDAFSRRPEGSIVLPGQISEEERQELRDALHIIEPFTLSLRAEQRLRTELEALTVQTALRIHFFLGERDEVAALGDLLSTRSPVPLFLAELILDGSLAAPADLPGRLRAERAGEFRAQLLALLVEGHVLHQVEKAFDAAKGLLAKAQTSPEKEQTLRALNGLAKELGASAQDEVDRLAASLPHMEARFRSLLEAERALRDGDTGRAETALEGTRDEADPYWLQLHAHWLLQAGDGSAATDDLLLASKLSPHPALLHRAAATAFEHGRLPEAVEALEMILTLQEDVTAHRNLATIYVQQGDYARAARQFALLRQCEPSDPSHSINEAEAWVRAGDGQASLRVYEALCATERPPLIAILKRTALLEALGRPQEAFTALLPWRSEYWDDQDYVGTLLRTAFAANEEETGHEALIRLKDLQRLGKADPDRLQEKTVDDIISQFQEYHEHEQELHRLLLQGRLPWLLADTALGRSGYRGWAFRTQPLTALGEEPTEWARFTIYSTNSSHAMTSHPRKVTAKEGVASLQRLECPPAGTTVVIDLTSMYTLHRLGFLPQAAAYFGKLLYPYDYLQLVLGEAGRLVFHQLSQKTVAEQIKSALDAQQIVVTATPHHMQGVPAVPVKEYVLAPDDDHSYKIKDVALALHQAGLIGDAAFDRAVPARIPDPLQAKPPGVDWERPPLRLGQVLQVELSTLKTFAQYDLLAPLLRGFRVEINPPDRQQVLSEARALTVQQQIFQWHRELWEFVRQRAEFVPIAKTMRPNGPEVPEDRKNSPEDFSIDAMQLAERLSVPLLADDRVCQTLILNTRRSSPDAAFGTERLLCALHKQGRVTDDQLADAFLALMRWRYRFLIPDARVLKTFADRHLSHPPGSELQEVAVYVHDCLRDPGLFAGFEPTEPPVTMGNRLFQDWCTVVAEFIMSCWADTRYSDDTARTITRWAVQELLPSPPHTMGPNSHALPALSTAFVLDHAIIRSVGLADLARANLGIRTVGEELGMTDTEYFSAVSKLIDET